MHAGSVVHDQNQGGVGILQVGPEGSDHVSTQDPGKGSWSQSQLRVLLRLHCCHEQREDASSHRQMRPRSGPRPHKEGADGPGDRVALRQP